MKICNRYLDYMETHDVVCDSAEWLDILAHAGRCPDCASAMKQRAEMLETLAGLDSPTYPADLHQRIIAEVESGSAQAPESVAWYDRLIDKFLRPLEVGFSLACILMIALMLNSENEPLPLPKTPVVKPLQLASHEPETMVNHDELDPVSPEEVKEFMARLERFNSRHPRQHSEPGPDAYMPELRLVNDWK